LKALEADPNEREAGFRLAYNLDLAGDDEEARQLLEQVCAGPSAPINALINLAVAYEDAGEYVRAERCLRMVLETDPNHPRARLYMKDVQASRHMNVDEEQRPRDLAASFSNTPITDFELSTRARNALKKMGVRTVGDLLRISEAEMMAYKNLGETTLLEIRSVLAQRGLKLGQALDRQRSAAREQVVQELAESGQEEKLDLLDRSVDELDLSVRAQKALTLLGITTMGDLVSRTEAELLGIKNFGATSLEEIKEKLTERGLSLRKLEE
ncbi:MAG TPA: DNA-directed RNA polymerase subunit alpha C-terminal domain-containing protein, partial [Sphingomicrobium sp.]|nr:DNA-directed RNA polymerase subunit alpha C-terminal domain-containing protein [Sphingomicrobium sp.]